MSEDLVERLWPTARVSLAAKVDLLRSGQRGTADDRAAAEVTHQLVGTLGSYRRTEAAAAAVRLDDLLRTGEAHPAGEHEDALIAVMERTVSR